ncbi:siderophore biosynthesis protein [Streptosporangiaceae bacterium NEAU-GS5]|nr:siderophore biosynthesis protein [Streptosporangiaceae bacterium NEAU-GS5]
MTQLARRVLDALLREDYRGIAARMTRDKDGAALVLTSGRRVRLAPGGLFQDFAVAETEELTLDEVLGTLTDIADPADDVTAFARECHETLTALRLRTIPATGTMRFDSLAAALGHPIYPTARGRSGLTPEQLIAYAPEFAPRFELRWARVPGSWPTPDFFPSEGLFPVHPLTAPYVPDVLPEPHLTVRPTLSMRTVEIDARTHLKLPLPTSTLGARNRRSIKPGTLEDGARAELLLREVLRREPDMPVLAADEQMYAHSGDEYLAWMVRRLPEGRIVTVAALPLVLEELSADPKGLLRDYLDVLLRWNVLLFVRYGIALEAHQQNLALVLPGPRLLIKDNDGLLASPGLLRTRGIDAPAFTDRRMLTDDPHALADVFVTITLHLAAAAVAVGAVGDQGRALVRDALARALAPYADEPMARLLRARTLDAARLVGKSMVTAGTLVAKERTGAKDINKYYGTSGPNYLWGA